jgi:hypothetical protein
VDQEGHESNEGHEMSQQRYSYSRALLVTVASV